MLNLLIITMAWALLAGLLIFESRENQTGRFFTKTPLSALFILAALLQPHPVVTYYYFLLVGLICCLVGDICLVFPQKRMFLLGLVFFLLGHVCYTTGFFNIAQVNQWTWIASPFALTISGCIFLRLKPHLSSMTLPVLLYAIVITTMLCGAWSFIGEAHLSDSGRIMVSAGATSFYISDIFVARQRFLKKAYLNQLIGLPLYYFGQFLLAFSVGKIID